MSARCNFCPKSFNPFSAQLCLSCAAKYCARPGNLCGQSCQGCRARVFAQDAVQASPQRRPQPRKPHSRCGQFHAVGTPCPQDFTQPIFSGQPKKPHNRCGHFHAVGTPCPQ